MGMCVCLSVCVLPLSPQDYEVLIILTGFLLNLELVISAEKLQ